jgi:hypothetical protein
MRSTIHACQDLDFSNNNISPTLLNTVFDVACNNAETIAARAFAIHTIINIGKYEPDVLRELIVALQDNKDLYPRAVKFKIEKAITYCAKHTNTNCT